MAGLNEQDVENDNFEFIEVMNVGDAPLDLTGVRLVESTVRSHRQGVVFNFASQTLEPGERIVAVRDREAFQSRYGGSVRIAGGSGGNVVNEGAYDGSLADIGERLTLVDGGGPNHFNSSTLASEIRGPIGRVVVAAHLR